jgi:glycosyltransferase involved in cell wall biosynthesis
MKLLYCIPELYNAGGMERVITEKVNYLATLANYEITIVTTDQQDKDIRFKLDNRIRLIHLNIDFDSHLNEKLFKKFLLHKRKLKLYRSKLIRIINELGVDICISLCGKEIEFLGNLPVKSKKIAEIHFSMNNRKQFILARHTGFIWSIFGDIRTYQLKKSVINFDKLIVLTNNDFQQWKNTHKNVLLIPNPNPLSNSIYSNLKSKRVITIGKLDPQKGYDLLIESWALVARKFPDWSLDIFGVGEWEHKLRSRIDELSLTTKVNLCGLTDDVLSNYLNSSIYVMSSRYEGLPMVLIEAMSCGLPIVSFDCEFGPSEIISDGKDGFLIPANDITQLAEKICMLIENKSLRMEFGLRAKNSAKRFSKLPIMNQWISLFDSLVEKEQN